MSVFRTSIDAALLKNIAALTPEQLLFAATALARRLPVPLPVPPYLEGYVDAVTPHRYSTAKACYCTAGPAVMTVDGTSFRMETGDLFLLPRNLEHYESYLNVDTPYELTWFQVHEWGTLLVHRSVYTADGRFRVADRCRAEAGWALLRDLDRLTVDGHVRKGTEWTTYHQELTAWFAAAATLKFTAHTPLTNKWQVRMLENVMDDVAARIDEDIDVKALAAAHDYSPAYLSTLFKKQYGLGLPQFIAREKLRKASVALQRTGAQVAQVARTAGYEDVSYFSRVFKKAFGVTPVEYRKNFS